MGWYVRPGMGSKKAMASRVGTGALGGQRRYRFRFTCAVEGEMEGRGGVRTISTGRPSWLYFFCSWVVCSSTYMGRGRVARIRYIEPLGHAARKAASAQLLPQARTWGTLEPRRSCTLAARGCAMPCCAKRKGAPRCCNRGRRYGHLHPFAHRCSAPSLAPEAAAGAAESHRWYNVEDYSSRLSAHKHHPGRKRHELSARSTRTHTPPTVTPQRLVVVERSC